MCLAALWGCGDGDGTSPTGSPLPPAARPSLVTAGTPLDAADYVFPDAATVDGSPDPAVWSARGTLTPLAVPGQGLAISDPDNTAKLLYLHSAPSLATPSRTATIRAKVSHGPVDDSSPAWSNDAIGWRLILDDGVVRVALTFARDPGTGTRQVRVENAAGAVPLDFAWDNDLPNTYEISRLANGYFAITCTSADPAAAIPVAKATYAASTLPRTAGSPLFGWGMDSDGGGLSYWQEVHAGSFAAGTGSEPVVLIGAGDIAACAAPYQDEATAALIREQPDALVFTVGDNAYPDGSAANYACYDASWGGFKDRTRPTVGNHEYHLPTVETSVAQDYFDYFNGIGVNGGPAGPRGKGYYAYDYGAWRIYGLNSYISTAAASAQVVWLKADLAANPRTCIMAVWHHPHFTSGTLHSRGTLVPVWDALTQAGAEVVISGHNHEYERFAPQTSAGLASVTGIRQFVVGTGGGPLPSALTPTPQPNSETRGLTWGVLKLKLYADKYDWEFIPIEGQTYTDAGSAECSAISQTPPPPPPASISLSVSGRLDLTREYVTLTWTGAAGSTVDVYRNGVWKVNTPNDGRYVNTLTAKSPVSYTYKVCQAGGTTCSNEGPVTFDPIVLKTSGRTDATRQYMTLTWTGARGVNVDVWRNGKLITATPNDGRYVNSRTFVGAASYTYKLCETGSAVCSRTSTVTFK